MYFDKANFLLNQADGKYHFKSILKDKKLITSIDWLSNDGSCVSNYESILEPTNKKEWCFKISKPLSSLGIADILDSGTLQAMWQTWCGFIFSISGVSAVEIDWFLIQSKKVLSGKI